MASVKTSQRISGSPGEDGGESLTPLERLEALCDQRSLQLIRSRVVSRSPGREYDGDGVIGGIGRVNGRPVACYAQDARHLAGSLGAVHGESISRILSIAEESKIPVVSFVESGGARLQEGTDALAGYATVFRHNVRLSGLVPQISIVSGLSAGGGSYSPALTDFTVMTRSSAMFLTGPGVVREVMGEKIQPDDLGGCGVHSRNGVCDAIASSDADAARLAAELLGFLPQHTADEPPLSPGVAPRLVDPAAVLPASTRQVYDVRRLIDGLVDEQSFLEMTPRWGRSIVTAFARIDGRPVGIVANQPRHMGGVLDVSSSEKGARFVSTCDRLGVPLLVLVDTPGFLPGAKQEHAGVIRFGAKLVRAFAAASVLKVTVVIRKAYGGAFIAMNSKNLGANLVLAWPSAEIGVMGAEAAVRFLRSGATDGAREEQVEAYRQTLSADAAARAGHVDEVVAPAETRARLIWALESLGARRQPARPWPL